MAIYTFMINQYRINLMRNGGINFPDLHAVIECKGMIEARKEGMLCVWVHKENNLPVNSYEEHDSGNWIRCIGFLHVPICEYSWYVDMLRNEHPVYGYIWDVNPSVNYLFSAWEDAGEGETFFRPEE